MSDIDCPYCDRLQEIDHDDGYGYEEDKLHEQECGDCGKTFTFTTGILFVYEGYKADCLNGGEHQYKNTNTYPKIFTRMKCKDCEKERQPTEQEWFDMMDNMETVGW